MIVPTHEPAWWGSLIWLGTVTVLAFGIAWSSGRFRIPRVWYIPLLFVTTVGMAVTYVEWLGAGLGSVVSTRWGWGLLAAAIAPIVLYKPMQHQPVTRHVHGSRLRRELVWEGGVYGVAEGVLLSALPPFITWQMVQSLGWTGGGLQTVARWALPLVAGALVVVIHHLGYWNYRNKILIPIALGLSVLSVGFLITGSWLAPAIGHIFMHFEATVHGTDMPPNDRPGRSVPIEQRQLVTAA
ncbi:MAG TPA: hypothetical protein VFJ17_05210 [Mycobacteriales bacterium]|jgi:hypothetical protein|nr:hypothetical protein [Mycobacteriales bacterium]